MPSGSTARLWRSTVAFALAAGAVVLSSVAALLSARVMACTFLCNDRGTPPIPQRANAVRHAVWNLAAPENVKKR